MRTYYLDIGSRTNIPVKAENIDNLRRNLIRDYDSEMKKGYGEIYVKALAGPKYGTYYERIGSLHFFERTYPSAAAPTGYYWVYRRDGKTMHARVSPKTGALLDVDKYWRRLFRWLSAITPTAPGSTTRTVSIRLGRHAWNF